MKVPSQYPSSSAKFVFAIAAIIGGAIPVAGGCSSISTNAVASAKALLPISITDAPSDEVIATSLTLNSVLLTDTAGKTASLLTSPLTFEATHLDAVQELHPLSCLPAPHHLSTRS